MTFFNFCTKAFFATAILCISFCLIFGQAKQAKKKITKQTEIEETKETKAQIFPLENGELTAKNITQDRKMSEYKQGGHFDCRNWMLKDEPRGQCDEKKIRDFIWQHWTDKKRGYVRVTYDSVDAISTSHIFIEPNEKGEWRIAWRIARFHAIPELNNLITDVPEIVTIERAEDTPEKGKWALIFKNKMGSIMEKIPEF